MGVPQGCLLSPVLMNLVLATFDEGLAPIGVLHTDQGNRPSLALDLMEEFRPLVVDNAVQTLAAHGRLKPEHGRRDAGGVLLTKAVREAVREGYETRMLQATSALPEFSGSLRRHLFRQAQQLRNAIMTEQAFTGLSWR